MDSKSFRLYTCVLLVMTATPAWAVQSHGKMEGLVVHQIGHLLFILGMAYLLVRIKSFQFISSGWMEFKAFLWLIISWNLLTFTGHYLNEFIAREKFFRAEGVIVSFSVTGLVDALYYFSRLDHLLLVPAFFFLLLALRKWREQG